MLLQFFLTRFLDLLIEHVKGKERFARFLFAWHEFAGTIAVSSKGTARSKEVWQELSHGQLNIPAADRSGLLFAVATCAYTFFKQQVSIIWNHYHIDI